MGYPPGLKLEPPGGPNRMAQPPPLLCHALAGARVRVPALEAVRAQLERATWRRAGGRWEAEVSEPIAHATWNRAYFCVACHVLSGDPESGPPAASLEDPARETSIDVSGLATAYT